MDFKIDEHSEETTSSKKQNRMISMIIIITCSITVGLLVFFVSNALFGKKEIPVQTPANLDVSLNNENVKILYDYVTYDAYNKRSEKFLKEKKVTIDSFSNEEKYYYALQFVEPEDFAETGELNQEQLKIYRISSAKVKYYMQRFFGKKITYSTSDTITYPFNFTINNKNIGVMKYSIEKDGYDTVFTGLQEEKEEKNIVEPYYTKLVKATKIGTDNSLELQEKVIFTDIEEIEGRYKVGVYRDYEKKSVIESKMNITKEQLEQNPINIDNYIDKAATITYTFKLNDNIYYFDSSEITY